MIEKIKIQNFGCYKNFSWDSSMRDPGNNILKFKKLNIIYGKNYSGKTTLSKIIRSLETRTLPEKYETPQFSIATSSGVIDQSNIATNTNDVRVYNTDFVEDHLSFLKSADGKITPFAIIGVENKSITEKIEELELQLESEDGNSGLRPSLTSIEKEEKDKSEAFAEAVDSLSLKLKNKATQPTIGIKHNPLYKDPNYNTPKILADLKLAKSLGFQILTSNKKEAQEALVREVPLHNITGTITAKLNLDDLHYNSRMALSKAITPSKAIQELLNDAIMQSWVKQGQKIHEGKRDNCGFCGQTIPPNLWERLNEHFSKESEELDSILDGLVNKIGDDRKNLSEILTIEQNAFYSSLHSKYDELRKKLTSEIEIYNKSLDILLKGLQKRRSDIFNSTIIVELKGNTSDIIDTLKEFSLLIENHNKKSKSLQQDQSQARRDLLLSELSVFALEINLNEEEKRIETLKKEKDSATSNLADIRKSIRSIEEEIEKLKAQLKDERKGAEQVNQYLNHYFGHNSLQLSAIENDESTGSTFSILRGGKPAYNLSEGECSLVGFCYFMAKLNDSESQGKNLIICIDDPISSLDSNHIFFIYSLIESLLAKPLEDANGNLIKDGNDRPVYPYKQMFISTHNLEFLKYLKRLSKPRNDHEHLLVVNGSGGSKIKPMPDYLRNYVTELNYLFGEIYICSDSNNSVSDHHSFYNFGNNLRKFLEAFLFFKYPFTDGDSKDQDKRIRLFFGGDQNVEPLVQRLINEFSHLAEYIDRSVQPIDHAEIERLARFILRKIKQNDNEQYKCFLQSIGKADPLPN